MKYNICFYCHSIPFTPDSIRLKTSLGGSETALISFAGELAKLGHSVTVLSTLADPKYSGIYNGVLWVHENELDRSFSGTDWDIFISLRFFSIFNRSIKSKLNILWNQDYLTDPNAFMAHMWQVDKLFMVSEWQKENYCEQLPALEPYCYVTANGIDPSLIPEGVEKDPNKLIFTSRPERGLKELLIIFSKMRRERPDLQLYISRYYSMYEPQSNMKERLDEADTLIAATEGVTFLGNLNKDQLYREISSSALHLYPGDFRETFGITGLEAQACGTPMVANNLAGLQTTLHNDAGIKIEPRNPFSKKYQNEFISACYDLLDNPIRYKKCQEVGKDHAKNFYYSDLTKQWVGEFDKLFSERYQKYSQQIYDNLVWHDDLLTAEYLASKKKVKEIESRAVPQPSYYYKHSIDPERSLMELRFGVVFDLIKDLKPKRILDFACGNGASTFLFGKNYSNASVLGIDYCQELIDIAKKFSNELDNVEFITGDIKNIEGKFDLIFVGEFLEHCRDYYEVVEELESHLSQNGTIIWTVPSGPFRELAEVEGVITYEGHVIHWEWNDIKNVFGYKEKLNVLYLKLSDSSRGSQVGHWIIAYKKSKAPTGEIDFKKKITITRPYISLSTCMIVKNAEDDLRKALKSIQRISDEIIIADGGSQDKTIEIAKEFTDKIYSIGRCPNVPKELPDPGAFDWSRNESIKPAKGSHILWLDSDEKLAGSQNLRKYLNLGSVFEGFVIRQNHLMLDEKDFFDVPIRVFKNNGKYHFRGIIHEQVVEKEDINQFPQPAFRLPDVEIAHYGYLTVADRIIRCTERNAALLKHDREIYPDRDLGKLLQIRERINFAQLDASKNGGIITPQGRLVIKEGLGEWHEWFSDPKHPLYKIAFEIYQRCLHTINYGGILRLDLGLGPQEIRYERAKDVIIYTKYMLSELFQLTEKDLESDKAG